jgi:hypothetical protein
MLILFDQNVPRRIRKFLTGHQVRVFPDLGWERLRNGVLLSAAESHGHDVMVTCDQNIRYQQNLSGRKIALVVLGSNLWPLLKEHLPEIVSAVNDARVGSYAFIEVPLPPKPIYRRED